MSRNLPATLLACALVIAVGLALLAVLLDRPASGEANPAPSSAVTLPVRCTVERACIPAEDVPYRVVRS